MSAVLWGWKQSRSLGTLGRVLGNGLCMGQVALEGRFDLFWQGAGWLE